MPLRFPSCWRFEPPKSGDPHSDQIPDAAIQDFLALIRRTSTQGDRQNFLEHFKGYFCAANGETHSRSSNVSWAETDLERQMEVAAQNPPLFIEAFHDACEAIRRRSDDEFAPDAQMINAVCQQHNIPYGIQDDNLVSGVPATTVSVVEVPPTLAERAQDILQRSLRRSDDLLHSGQGREAVQEALWLLETIATAFAGKETGTGTVEGKYFNEIAKDLRRLHPGTTLERVLRWVTETHGYINTASMFLFGL